MPETQSKTENEKQEKIKRASKFSSEYNNPCLKEHNISIRCMSENDYNGEKCKKEFDNYNGCKAFWNHIRLDRRRKGIEPYLPEPGEREKIKADYLAEQRKDFRS